MARWIIVHDRTGSLVIPADRIVRVNQTVFGSQLWLGRRDSAEKITVRESPEEIFRLVQSSEASPSNEPRS